MMPDDAASDDDSQDESRDGKVEKKTFTKGSFKEPMKGLLTALSRLCSTLDNRGEHSLLLDEVLIQYNVIADMTTNGERFEVIQQDTDDNDASNNNGEKEISQV